MYPYNPFGYLDPFGGSGGGPWQPPFPVGGGGGGGGFFDGLGGIIGDVLDIVEDVDDIIDIFGGGGGSGGSGGTPTGGGFPGSTAGANPFTGLVGNVGGGNSDVLVANLENQSSFETSFLEFLRAVGVTASILGWLWENPPITWPAIAKDMFAAWFNNNSPAQPDSVVAPLVPVDWKGGSPTLPTAPSVLPGFSGTGVAPMAMAAVPTQVYKAPKGYVTVNVPVGNGQSQKMFVLKKVATAMGLYKARKKAPITGKEYHYIKKAKRWEDKLANMLKGSCNHKVTRKR